MSKNTTKLETPKTKPSKYFLDTFQDKHNGVRMRTDPISFLSSWMSIIFLYLGYQGTTRSG